MATLTNDRAVKINIELFENNYRGFALRYKDQTDITGFAFTLNYAHGKGGAMTFTIDAATPNNTYFQKAGNTLVITKLLDYLFPIVVGYSRTLEVISTDLDGYIYTDYVITLKGSKY